MQNRPVRSIVWFDLTVPNAEAVRDFYAEVVGWEPADHDMGDYNDYDMKHPDTGETVSGVCHAMGMNAEIPPQWMLYITVPDLTASMEAVVRMGGKVIIPPRSDTVRLCIIQDPAGAMCALMEQQDE